MCEVRSFILLRKSMATVASFVGHIFTVSAAVWAAELSWQVAAVLLAVDGDGEPEAVW